MASQWNFDKLEQQIPETMKFINEEVAQVTQSYFERSWKRQAWDGIHWKQVQRRIAGTAAYKANKAGRTRAILVGTGALRADFQIKYQGSSEFKIINSRKYADVHNDGLTIHKSSSEKIISFNRDRKFAKNRTRKQQNMVTHQQKVTIPAHDIKMPQRRFMGQTAELTKIQEKVIYNIIKHMFEK